MKTYLTIIFSSEGSSPSEVTNQLLNMGVLVHNIYIDSTCTHCDNVRFYSYRCDKDQSGRMMGIIGFKNALNT